jgi:Flp pilus assembly pilin Flp
MSLYTQFIREEDGQDVVEYGLLIATVSFLVVVGTTSFAARVTTWFGALAGQFVVLVGP